LPLNFPPKYADFLSLLKFCFWVFSFSFL
jgi:hypothetical protein